MVLTSTPLKKRGYPKSYPDKYHPTHYPSRITVMSNCTNVKYCNKSFKHKSNKSRHEKNRCTKRNYINENNKITYTQEDFEEREVR